MVIKTKTDTVYIDIVDGKIQIKYNSIDYILKDGYIKPVEFSFNQPIIPMNNHPLTCDCSGRDICERFNNTGEGELIKTDDGFICKCGVYKQKKI